MNQHEHWVHIVDDDEGMTRSLQMMFATRNIKSTAYSSAEDFLERAVWDSPGCLILDLRMPGMGGERLLSTLATHMPGVPVIVLTAHGTIEAAVRAMKAGAVEFLQKPCESEVLVERVQSLVEKDRKRMEGMEKTDELLKRLQTLTPREMDVVKLVAGGLTSADIGTRLGVQAKSIEVYRCKILAKLGVATSAELISRLVRADPVRWGQV
jgi:FixJ family two-component response regulator